jgi:hypothetical protein
LSTTHIIITSNSVIFVPLFVVVVDYPSIH